MYSEHADRGSSIAPEVPLVEAMKQRIEMSGIHFFDRCTGVHFLFDEIKPDESSWSVAPRCLSIALSNICDLQCSYCYRPKNRDMLSPEFVKQIIKSVNDLGCMEVTLGGGEPLLYPNLTGLCEWIWDNTDLGVSLTTHGHHLSTRLIKQLTGKLSSIRFSIDGIEPYYSSVRGRPLRHLIERIRALDHGIPFGINLMVSHGHAAELVPAIDLAISLGAGDILIIPEHGPDGLVLDASEWALVADAISSYQSQCQLCVTYGACEYLKVSFLPTEREEEFVYAHVSADRKLKIDSYTHDGIPIQDCRQMRDYLMALRQSHWSRNENMASIQ